MSPPVGAGQSARVYRETANLAEDASRVDLSGRAAVAAAVTLIYTILGARRMWSELSRVIRSKCEAFPILFGAQFGITEHDLERYLSEALSAGGDYADLYFEYLSTSSIGIDEGIVKSATEGVTLGVGVRVIAGERTGYAYSDDLSPEKIRKAARVAALIARGPASIVKTGFEEARSTICIRCSPRRTRWVSPSAWIWSSAPITRPAPMIRACFRCRPPMPIAPRSAGRDQRRPPEFRPAADGADGRRGAGARGRRVIRSSGYSGGGGRVTLDFFLNEKTPEHFAREAARQAIVQLGAVDAPAGEMTVVLGPGWPGILLHEAVGHGLEADFNRKGVSAFSGRVGQQVASPLCTVIDDGTIGTGADR